MEDDPDDQYIFSLVFDELALDTDIVFKRNSADALAYLRKSRVYPFLVFSDINVPNVNGFRLRDAVQQELIIKRKCIPFLFFTTAIDHKSIHEAYALSAQEFFVNPIEYRKLKDIVRKIVDYWRECHYPAI